MMLQVIDVLQYVYVYCVCMRSHICWVCAGMLGDRGLVLVVHFPSGCVAKINISCVTVTVTMTVTMTVTVTHAHACMHMYKHAYTQGMHT
jgi:hypothetical protein